MLRPVRGERVLDHCRGGVRKVLPSAVAEAIEASIISTAGGDWRWEDGVVWWRRWCRRWGPVGRCLQWQAVVARVAGSVRQSSERGRVV